MFLARPTYKQKYQLFIHKMINDIEKGNIKPGDYLPSENDLAVMFGLSRSSIRKGIEQFVTMGLIEKIPRKGNRVLEYEGSAAMLENIFLFL